MGCQACDDTEDIAYYRVPAVVKGVTVWSNVGIIACNDHFNTVRAHMQLEVIPDPSDRPVIRVKRGLES